MNKEPTDTQKEILDARGKLVVRACPGSGKTFTVASKMANILKKWPYHYQGIAGISFTNVAWQEIQEELKNSFSINIPIEHPHFLGTIDSFINRFIFFPHGHLILECNQRPVLVGEPVFPWKLKNYERDYYQYFDKVSYDIDGNISPITSLNQFHFVWKRYNKNGSEDGNYTNIKNMKSNLIRRGLVNQSDVDYFSMKLLEKYPSIAKALILRFPCIFVDEAQDTSEVQMRIFEILVENGLDDIILVGDPDQSIFEWNGAKPELFEKKILEWGSCITMNDNWRSSQNICNFTYHLSNLPEKSISVNEFKDYSHKPEIWTYDHKNPDFKKLINNFLDLCESESIMHNAKNIAILSRSRNLMNEIILSKNKYSLSSKNINPWIKNNLVKELMYSKYLYDNYEFQESFRLLERTYMSLLKNRVIYSNYELSELINKAGYFNYKKEIFEFLQLMPKTNLNLGDWINEFEKTITENKIRLKIDLEINNDFNDLDFDDVFGYKNPQDKFVLSTIHKVKGETYDAVLLIMKKKSANNQNYRTMLNNNEKTKNEELRNVYVGITRPRKILVIGVPSDDENDWNNYFFGSKQKKLSDFF